jgi:hypothetical protein
MGRLRKIKRKKILEANKKMLGEQHVDHNKVLNIMKYKFGQGDLSHDFIERFDEWLGNVENELSDEEYADLFNDWLNIEK